MRDYLHNHKHTFQNNIICITRAHLNQWTRCKSRYL